jgi:Uri superfamily endonuclease
MHALGAACDGRAAAGLRQLTPDGEEPGTYVLVLRSTERRSVKVGRLGVLRLEPGYYAYAGSALGPGGIRARLGRHLRGPRRAHWHIDYLRAYAHPIEAWYCRDSSRREHLWSDALGASCGASIPLSGDCSCESHLFFFARRPSHAVFQETLLQEGLLTGRLLRWSGGPSTDL